MKTTTEQKHTPGPWHTERPFNEPGIYIGSESTALIAKVYEHDGLGGTTEQEERARLEDEANARLIAASPLLLEYLKASTNMLELCAEIVSDSSRQKDAVMIRSRIALNWAAIERAEGKQ